MAVAFSFHAFRLYSWYVRLLVLAPFAQFSNALGLPFQFGAFGLLPLGKGFSFLRDAPTLALHSAVYAV
ncbi:hypothetical protein BN873_990022 [Candidatus Competibacter denitrificans Run_A_D11]|uniref:Uncharacterized protein n=1 Tax=Candidatus Competibacter denitrificans Run_A_D11 TaxID=1400863 RepID=W6M961_9GAMM|nr:hypothetical protein BN873_990022 [Candidatus Competibacter denitrificans Run_A_D11]